ncbi:hypothetical protein DFH07DRAFT_400966 [Mycena maculata]|uniref:Uncharacterized protein n=1 Tax=Mycena maculata TaxID=230809 RepID=A0AAD7H688_9AGAR|nr:hypothetical protein DFH07DRAFT_400966 [Mycena maculata]
MGCRAGSYLIYGFLSTLIWMMLVGSSVLAHYSTFTTTFNYPYQGYSLDRNSFDHSAACAGLENVWQP